MNEQAPEPEAPAPVPAEPSGEGGTDARLSSLEDKMADLIAFIKGGAGKPAEPEPERDIKAEAREAVREVQAAEKKKADAEQDRQSVRDRIAHLEAMAEKPPEEYRRVTQAMGWNKP